MSESTKKIGLSVSDCRTRQQRLCRYLTEQRLDAALLTDRRHVHYLTGCWLGGRPLFDVALLLCADGASVLALPGPTNVPVAADDVISFTAQRLSTIVDDQPAECIDALRPHLTKLRRLGCDEAKYPWLFENWQIVDLTGALLALRRTKDPDEIELIKVAIAGAQAVYQHAREHVEPGLTELELYAQLQAAAVQAVGEPITEFGNDFQCNSAGGPPRHRPMQQGEMVVYDISVVVRAYGSDLCRTFVVGAEPTDAQARAHRRVIEALAHVESTVRPGVSCKRFFNEVSEILEEENRWTFGHHLGHGIGLSAHEAPRLNPHWDDTFQIGDVFTAEPGLYGDDLHAGLRIEDNYLVTTDGVQRLSHFPTDL